MGSPEVTLLISLPTQTVLADELLISAKVRSTAKAGLPSELWFRFPKNTGLEISCDSDPFAVALLLLAMQNGEPLQLEGTLSRKLFEGLGRYQAVFHEWFPERFKIIAIEPSGLRDDPWAPAEGRGEACAFSGGVDSFYSLLSLLGRVPGQPAAPLTHAIFMGGFDMPLNLTWSISELTRSYAGMMKTLGVGFIAGSTNVRNFVNTVDWTNAHGQALAASALFFKANWSCFHVPASYTNGTYPKWGTHPSLDPLLSVEALEFRHHGSGANRVRKLEAIARAPESHERLRVCWIQDIGLKNCGRCEKCVRTMVALDILGKLGRYRTFEAEKSLGAKIRSLPQRTHQARLFARELMVEAMRRAKFRTCADLGYSLLKRELFYRSNLKRQTPDSPGRQPGASG